MASSDPRSNLLPVVIKAVNALTSEYPGIIYPSSVQDWVCLNLTEYPQFDRNAVFTAMMKLAQGETAILSPRYQIYCPGCGDVVPDDYASAVEAIEAFLESGCKECSYEDEVPADYVFTNFYPSQHLLDVLAIDSQIADQKKTPQARLDVLLGRLKKAKAFLTRLALPNSMPRTQVAVIAILGIGRP